jgi:hypothetical protein
MHSINIKKIKKIRGGLNKSRLIFCKLISLTIEFLSHMVQMLDFQV